MSGGPGSRFTVGELLQEGREGLARQARSGSAFEPSTRESALLLGYVLGLGEASILARTDEPMAPEAATRFRALLARRLEGEPVAYLVGEREFYGRSFLVDRRVLIPRPETEHLIEAALALDLPATPRILDVGTGSGCIAVTLAAEIPGARVVGTDLSLDALTVARANAERHGVAQRVTPVRADLVSPLALERFDLVASNPPYVARREHDRLSPEVRDYEPHLALFANGSGRAAIERLLRSAAGLRPGVSLLLEIGYDQSEWLRKEVAASPVLEVVEIVEDYARHPRTAVLRRR